MSSLAKTAILESPDSESICPVHQVPGIMLGTSGNTDVYQCPTCRLCYLGKSVRPKATLDNQWYENFHEHPEWGKNFLDQLRPAYSRQVRVLEQLTTGRRLADVGCGVGVFLAAAKEANWDVLGIEESAHAAKFAVKAYGLNYATSLKSVERESMDVVRLSHVLEHIFEPIPFLEEIKTLLKPNGVLAIAVPNREPLSCKIINKARALLSSKPKLAGAIYPNMHVLGFSVQSLTAVVTSVGLEPEKVFTIGMGNRTYFPMFYDGLLQILDPRERPLKEYPRYWLPLLANNLGNRFGLGEWIVGYFRKKA